MANETTKETIQPKAKEAPPGWQSQLGFKLLPAGIALALALLIGFVYVSVRSTSSSTRSWI